MSSKVALVWLTLLIGLYAIGRLESAADWEERAVPAGVKEEDPLVLSKAVPKRELLEREGI